MSALAMSDAPPPRSGEDDRWEAVRRRDRAADGRFVYAVRTTGVYCRPSCGARLARRENVSFHLSCLAAEAAGFRPCKRCRPDLLVDDAQAGRVTVACRRVEAAVEAGEPVPSLEALAEAAGLSRFHFHRLFKAQVGVTPRAYASRLRAERAKSALENGGSITEAIYEAGYSSASRFYARATEQLGMTPSIYRGGGRGQHLHFAVAESSLGALLVAATAAGVCAIQFGDDPQSLERDLRRRFPAAVLDSGDAGFQDLVARVVALAEAPGSDDALPLDIRGTAFQERVWQALRGIPAGQTASYAEIAAAIGHPRAVRAVAQACAANPVAVAVPCHRVVRSDGALSGYRWGVERKRALLAREAAGVQTPDD